MPIDINMGTTSFDTQYVTGQYTSTVTATPDYTIYNTGLLFGNFFTYTFNIANISDSDFAMDPSIKYSISATNDGVMQLGDYVDFAYLLEGQVCRVRLMYSDTYPTRDLVVQPGTFNNLTYDDNTNNAMDYLFNLMKTLTSSLTNYLTVLLDTVAESNMQVYECILRTLINHMKNDPNNEYLTTVTDMYNNWGITYSYGIIQMNPINMWVANVTLDNNQVYQTGLNAFKDVAGFLLTTMPDPINNYPAMNTFNFMISVRYGVIGQLNSVPDQAVMFEFSSAQYQPAPPPDNGGGTDPPPDNGGGIDPPPDNGGGIDPPPDNGGGIDPPPDNGGGSVIDTGSGTINTSTTTTTNTSTTTTTTTGGTIPP